MDIYYHPNKDFPNLPWMIDGDVKITQSLAILKYIARKHGLSHDGTQKGEAIADMVEVFIRVPKRK